jgi:hypothetical protein
MRLVAIMAALAAIVIPLCSHAQQTLEFNGYYGTILDSEDAAASEACKFQLGSPVLPPLNPVTTEIVDGWASFLEWLAHANNIARSKKQSVKPVEHSFQITDETTYMWYFAMWTRQKVSRKVYASLGIAGDNVMKLFDDAANRCNRHLLRSGVFVIDRRFESPPKDFLTPQ